MNDFNKNKYQIIYPYTSDKIYVEKDLNHGAYKCYQELENLNIKTKLFMIHDIDSGIIYHFNIPKYDNEKHISHENTIKIQSQTDQTYIIDKPDTNKHNTNKYNDEKLNDIITRLNNVEHQLDSIKETISQSQTEGCILM